MYKDKERQRIYQKEWYKRNKDKHVFNVRQNEKRYIVRAMSFIRNYLLDHPCVDCGETDWVVLDFDHVRGTKLHNVSNLIQNGFSLDKIKLEISKCDVRCANCHRRVTAKRSNFYKYL